MTELKWEDPPSQRQGPGRGKWEPIKAELKANQGKWAVLVDESTEEPTKVIAQIRSSFVLKDGFITRVQNKYNLPIRVWATYDPEEAKRRKEAYQNNRRP